MRFTGRLVEGTQKFPLHIACEAATLAPALDHLVGDLLGGGRHEIVRLEPLLRHEAGEGLLAQIAFDVLHGI